MARRSHSTFGMATSDAMSMKSFCVSYGSLAYIAGATVNAPELMSSV